MLFSAGGKIPIVWMVLCKFISPTNGSLLSEKCLVYSGQFNYTMLAQCLSTMILLNKDQNDR